MSAARVLRIGLAVLLLGLLVMLSTLGGSAEEQPKSALSNGPSGRLGALALLQELGFDARAWERPPGYLPSDGTLCWLPRVPFELDATDEEAAKDAELLGEAHSPAAYRSFVARGGTLVMAHGPGIRALLGEHFGLTAFDGLAAPGEAGTTSTEIPWDGGETLVIDWPETDPLSDVARGDVVEALSDASGRAIALRASLGAGQVVLLAWDGFLDNERIDDGDAALLLVRLTELLAPGSTILFDEYALGRWAPESKLAIAFGSHLGVFSTQLLLLLCVFAWRAVWVREFPRDPPALELVSPLARAQASASLHLRARRADRLARVLRRAVLARLADEVDLRPPAAAEPDAPAEEERERALLARVCARLGAACSQADLEARLFHAIRGEADLRRMEEALASLEARVAGASGRAAPVLG